MTVLEEAAHVPVLLAETLCVLDLRDGDAVVDATVGAGGHAREILARVSPSGRLVGIDADASALDEARRNLRGFEGSFSLHNANFADLGRIMDESGLPRADKFLFDLGVSSMQLGDPGRGFSFRKDGPLDMRMDARQRTDAKLLVNTLPERELADVFFKFGEERRSRAVARAIVKARGARGIETTAELAAIISRAVGCREHRRIHPATRCFQALRMAVNDELGSLERGLAGALGRLNPGGRVAVISFHSLEDRLVKRAFRAFAAGGGRIVTKKAVMASASEIFQNRRARSARLRCVERSRQ